MLTSLISLQGQASEKRGGGGGGGCWGVSERWKERKTDSEMERVKKRGRVKAETEVAKQLIVFTAWHFISTLKQRKSITGTG